jgi:Invasion associated locus B (IalB) protein
MKLLPCLALSWAALVAAPAVLAQSAASPTQISSGKGWDAWSFTEKAGRVCYLVGSPEKSEPANLKRGRVDVVVTDRPGEKTFNVVNFDLGYPVKPGSNGELDIDGQKFTLFTDKDAAWNPDATSDRQVTEAFAKGHRAIFKGTSVRGTVTTDTYNLDGFTSALDAVDKTCGVKR